MSIGTLLYEFLTIIKTLVKFIYAKKKLKYFMFKNIVIGFIVSKNLKIVVVILLFRNCVEQLFNNLTSVIDNCTWKNNFILVRLELA